MKVPETSTSLLKALSADSKSIRWREFVDRYRPMMEGYLAAKFPSLEKDDIIQEAFIALSRVLPNYRYEPDETGTFHDYIAAVLRHKACDALKREARWRQNVERVTTDPVFSMPEQPTDQRLRKCIYKIALKQVLGDAGILERNKRVFVETAINGRKPSEVAEMFGLTRNNVDQIKARILKALQEKVLEIAGLVDE